MKKIILPLLFLFCLIPALAGADSFVVIGRPCPGGAAASCSTYVSNATGSTALAVANSTGTYYRGWKGQLADNKSVCKVIWKMTKAAGDISGKTYTCRIWSLNINNLNVELGASTGVTGSNSWSNTEVEFTFPTPVSLSSGTNYAITLDIGAYDATNYANVFNSGADSIANWGYDRWAADKASQSASLNDIVVNIYAQ